MTRQMRVIVSIVAYESYEKLLAIFKEGDFPLSVVVHGHGTADSVMLDYLGLSETRKVIAMSLLTQKRAQQLFSHLVEGLALNAPGRGIAFSSPISSMSTFLSSLLVVDDNRHTLQVEEDLPMQKTYTHEIIVTIVTKGAFTEVKTAANEAGAKGGTLIHSLGLGGEEAQKFLGISIQPEKDIILIVVRKEEKQKVMEAIAKVAGIHTEGKGILFSVPVDKAYGLAEGEAEEK